MEMGCFMCNCASNCHIKLEWRWHIILMSDMESHWEANVTGWLCLQVPNTCTWCWVTAYLACFVFLVCNGKWFVWGIKWIDTYEGTDKCQLSFLRTNPSYWFYRRRNWDLDRKSAFFQITQKVRGKCRTKGPPCFTPPWTLLKILVHSKFHQPQQLEIHPKTQPTMILSIFHPLWHTSLLKWKAFQLSRGHRAQPSSCRVLPLSWQQTSGQVAVLRFTHALLWLFRQPPSPSPISFVIFITCSFHLWVSCRKREAGAPFRQHERRRKGKVMSVFALLSAVFPAASQWTLHSNPIAYY